MIERLRARTEELEQQVAARTADLVTTNRELEEAQQRYHSLFAQNPDGVFAMDLEGRILSVNPAGEKLSGYTAAILVGHTFSEASSGNPRTEELSRRIERVMHGEAVQWEASIKHREGHQIEIHVTMMPTVVDGRIVGAFGIVKDITERKTTEHAMARSEERFRALVQNGAELISVVEADGVVRYASPSVETLLGVHADSAIGVNLFSHLHPEDEPVLRRLFEIAVASPSQNLTEAFRLRTADGAWRHVEVVCRNLAAVAEIGGIVLNVRDVTERKALEAELAYRAYHDALTGLPNRALLIDRLGHALARSTRSRLNTGVLFIDLDDFKLVNDSLGHKQGDQLLVSVAQRLSASIRPGDSVARLGGDEFIVLFEDLADVSDASSVAERILQQLGTAFELDGREVFISATMGMAVSGANTVLADDLLRDADVAMYAAKARGKGHWALYEPGMDTRPLERLELEADLRRAMVGGELRLHYQPIVEIATGQIRGVEALLRWEHPERGLVSPMEFISIAEETGLIVPIGRWVLHDACRQARVWDERHAGRPALTISVNISSRQFQHPGLVEDVRQALEDAHLLPSRLRLEITESVAMERGQATVQTLQALKSLGVRLAIDDFGTGYSSLAYLKHFPVDVLKVDRAFVDGLGRDAQDVAIVRSVITIAKSLDLTVTGEGVETAEQLSVLRALGCDEAQGYYFARPQPPGAMDRLLDAQLARQEDLPRAA
jgi:diguanylate cyclase (GGDEF)-like protein/PAS domain S-box-containing protein